MNMEETFDARIYKNIPYDDLLIFALYSIIQKNLDPNFENLVVECYTLFPERFGLPGYIEKYPDSAQVEKSWLRCRTDKRLITGNKAQGFELTARGIETVQKVQKRLGGKTINTKKLLEMQPIYVGQKNYKKNLSLIIIKFNINIFCRKIFNIFMGCYWSFFKGFIKIY